MEDAVDQGGGSVGAEEKVFGGGGGEDKAVDGEIRIENHHQRIAVRPRGKSPASKRTVEFFQCGLCACTSAYARKERQGLAAGGGKGGIAQPGMGRGFVGGDVHEMEFVGIEQERDLKRF
jgi:hypothetical protein